jgi:hypothetical protein
MKRVGVGVVRAPAAALGPPPRLRAPGNRVAGALADVACLGGAVGEVVVDVAGPRLVAEAALAARPGVGKAATVALVGDAGVVVVAVDVDAAKAEAVAVVVAVDAVGRRLLGSLDEIGGAVVDAEVVGSIHARGRVEGDGDRRVLEPNERAAATTAHEGQQCCNQDRCWCPPDLHQTPRSSNVNVARIPVDALVVRLMDLTAEFSTLS